MSQVEDTSGKVSKRSGSDVRHRDGPRVGGGPEDSSPAGCGGRRGAGPMSEEMSTSAGQRGGAEGGRGLPPPREQPGGPCLFLSPVSYKNTGRKATLKAETARMSFPVLRLSSPGTPVLEAESWAVAEGPALCVLNDLLQDTRAHVSDRRGHGRCPRAPTRLSVSRTQGPDSDPPDRVLWVLARDGAAALPQARRGGWRGALQLSFQLMISPCSWLAGQIPCKPEARGVGPDPLCPQGSLWAGALLGAGGRWGAGLGKRGSRK